MPQDRQMNEGIEEILEAVARREDRERASEIEEKTVQLVVFAFDDRFYAFYGELIQEIVTVTEIAYVPGMPDYLPGIINVRGEIESVLDLRRVFGLPSVPLTTQSRIVIGEVDAVRSGILVDSVEDVLEVPEESIQLAPSVLEVEFAEYIIGEATYKGHNLTLLDLKKIFRNLLKTE